MTRGDIANLVAVAALAFSIAFLAYHVGDLRGRSAGRQHGYAQCLGEQDDDRPRYATGGREK